MKNVPQYSSVGMIQGDVTYSQEGHIMVKTSHYKSGVVAAAEEMSHKSKSPDGGRHACLAQAQATHMTIVLLTAATSTISVSHVKETCLLLLFMCGQIQINLPMCRYNRDD